MILKIPIRLGFFLFITINSIVVFGAENFGVLRSIDRGYPLHSLKEPNKFKTKEKK